MPIYEFYCSACHALFSFYSARVDTEKRPSCPRCGTPELERKPARFATLGGAAEGEDGEPEDARLDRAMAQLAGELESAADGDDPRQMARMMRRLGEASGLDLGSGMESMIARLEAGEDPDALDDEMAELEGAEGSDAGELFRLRRRAAARRSRRPTVDDELYFL
ncbi:MAG: zinc ribbon domain-containing protein [Acidobacteriota bacterium]|nr:zinc ribbon domain-containing protein [Acidobacteriota bacterium]MDH3522977.1 zinc ribbon domain-containing protein [Acidobacteriota bacterium]